MLRCHYSMIKICNSHSLPFHDVTFFDLTTVKSQNYVYVSTVGLNKVTLLEMYYFYSGT